MTRPLNDKEEVFVQALAAGATVVAASKKAGVSEQSGHAWKKKPHVKSALQQAQLAIQQGQIRVIESVAAQRTRASVPDVNDKLQEGGIKAIDFLVELINNPDARIRDRLDASKELIRLSGVVELQRVFVERQTIPPQPNKGLTEQTAADIRKSILGVS